MPALSEHTNVYNTSLLILQQKGFQLWYDDGARCFCAERDGWDFMSESPCGLLGLVAIFEQKGPTEWREYWWREDGPKLYGHLPKVALPYESVLKRKSKR